MFKLSPALFCLLLVTSSFAQQKMRPLSELINTTDPGWPLVKQWIAKAKNKVEVLPPDSAKASEALYQTQVTTRSPMGAILYETGGLLIDYGWIRILGSGSKKLNRSLPGWNKGKSFKEFGEPSSFYLIADDAVGGFFAINGGAWSKDVGKIFYLSPDALEWEPLGLSYTDFLHFCFNNNLNEFYEGQRWNNWRKEIDTLDGTKVYNFVPPLWTKEGKNINSSFRKAIPVEEQYSFNMEMRKQLGITDKQ